jgi:hypothetical protein
MNCSDTATCTECVSGYYLESGWCAADPADTTAASTEMSYMETYGAWISRAGHFKVDIVFH